MEEDSRATIVDNSLASVRYPERRVATSTRSAECRDPSPSHSPESAEECRDRARGRPPGRGGHEPIAALVCVCEFHVAASMAVPISKNRASRTSTKKGCIGCRREAWIRGHCGPRPVQMVGAPTSMRDDIGRGRGMESFRGDARWRPYRVPAQHLANRRADGRPAGKGPMRSTDNRSTC